MWSSMANGFIALEFNDKLQDGLAQAQKRFERAARIATESMAPEVESYMKVNAPWTDQTSNARNGLAARAYTDGSEQGIILFHQVDYGIWLETRFGGRNAIINPTIERMGPRVMSRFNRILERS